MAGVSNMSSLFINGTERNLKNSTGRGVQSMTLKQWSIEREVILELKMCKKFIELIILYMLQNKFPRFIQE